MYFVAVYMCIMWHNSYIADGHHKLVRWRIVTHCGIVDLLFIYIVQQITVQVQL